MFVLSVLAANALFIVAILKSFNYDMATTQNHVTPEEKNQKTLHHALSLDLDQKFSQNWLPQKSKPQTLLPLFRQKSPHLKIQEK